MVRSFAVALFATLLMAFTGSAFAQSPGTAAEAKAALIPISVQCFARTPGAPPVFDPGTEPFSRSRALQMGGPSSYVVLNECHRQSFCIPGKPLIYQPLLVTSSDKHQSIKFCINPWYSA